MQELQNFILPSVDNKIDDIADNLRKLEQNFEIWNHNSTKNDLINNNLKRILPMISSDGTLMLA